MTSPPVDLTVRGARLAQPDGTLSAPHDLRCSAGRITAITASCGGGGPGTVIDADGRLATPGFIDTHVHGEAAVFEPEVQLAMLRQGVTTIITGQDGVSFAPSPGTAAAAAWAGEYFAAINGAHPRFRSGGVADLLRTYRGTSAVNVAYLAPHGTIRYAVAGARDGAVTADELADMQHLLRQALAEGACGMSTGLEYLPSAYADVAELAALTQVVAEFDLPHVSHMRGYGNAAPAALEELLDVARASGVATHVSHLHAPGREITTQLDAASADGLSVTYDSYPYSRSSTILSMVTLPRWLPLADAAATRNALRDPAVVRRLREQHFAGMSELWPRLTVAYAPTDEPGELAWTHGKTLPEVAGERPIIDVVIDLLIRTRLRISCVVDRPAVGEPDGPLTLATHPMHMVGSDAIYSAGHPHPRGWGAFARFLETIVRGGHLSWADGITHTATAAARRFGFEDRGTLQPGAVADVALLDPDNVADEATFSEPRNLATGIDDVIVAGVPVLRAGVLTGAQPGSPVSPTRARPVPTPGGHR